MICSTHHPQDRFQHWAIFGLGSGAGFQQPVLAARTVLDLQDVPIGVAINMILQIFSGTLFVSVAQDFLTTRLISTLATNLHRWCSHQSITCWDRMKWINQLLQMDDWAVPAPGHAQPTSQQHGCMSAMCLHASNMAADQQHPYISATWQQRAYMAATSLHLSTLVYVKDGSLFLPCLVRIFV